MAANQQIATSTGSTGVDADARARAGGRLEAWRRSECLVGDDSTILTEAEFKSVLGRDDTNARKLERSWQDMFNKPIGSKEKKEFPDVEPHSCTKKGNCAQHRDWTIRIGNTMGSLIGAWAAAAAPAAAAAAAPAPAPAPAPAAPAAPAPAPGPPPPPPIPTSDGDYLSVWSLHTSAASADRTTMATEARPGLCARYCMLAHVLFSPLRITVLPLEPLDVTYRDGDHCRLRMQRNSNGGLNFQLLYTWIGQVWRPGLVWSG